MFCFTGCFCQSVFNELCYFSTCSPVLCVSRCVSVCSAAAGLNFNSCARGQEAEEVCFPRFTHTHARTQTRTLKLNDTKEVKTRWYQLLRGDLKKTNRSKETEPSRQQLVEPHLWTRNRVFTPRGKVEPQLRDGNNRHRADRQMSRRPQTST